MLKGVTSALFNETMNVAIENNTFLNKSNSFSKYDYTSTRDDYLTPPEIIQTVLENNNRLFFDCDVCCSIDNIPAKFRYRKDGLYLNSGNKVSHNDGLTGTWFPFNWCNPPFDLCKEFIVKAVSEQAKGHTTVMLIPARTETAYWANYILENGKATKLDIDVEFLRKGLRFLHPETGKQMPVFKNSLALITFKGWEKKVVDSKSEVPNA